MYFIAVALTAAVFINERKQGLLDRSLVAGIFIFFLFRLKVLFLSPQFYGAHHMFTNQENKDFTRLICIIFITFLLSFAISRCPNDRNYVGPFGQSVYRSGRTDGTRLPLHVACFKHFVQWQFATSHFHHSGSGSLRHVLRYFIIIFLI